MTNNNLSTTDRISLLESFIQIVESKSLSGAARNLKTTQPTISRRLKALENSLGVKLIQRTTHQMHLTDEGTSLYDYAKDILERWSSIEETIGGTRNQASGTLRVHVPHVLGQEQLIKILDKYLKENPKVKVEWLLKDRLPNFASENIDCAIHVGYIQEPSLVAIRLFDISRVIVAAPSIANSLDKLSDPKNLSLIPWLSFKTFYDDQIELSNKKTKSKISVQFESVFSTDNFHALRKMALMGHGACIVSKWAIEDDLKQSKLVQLCPTWEASGFSVYLTYPQTRNKPAKLKNFIELIKNEKFLND